MPSNQLAQAAQALSTDFEMRTGVVKTASARSASVVVTVDKTDIPMRSVVSDWYLVGDTVTVLRQDATYLCLGRTNQDAFHAVALQSGWGGFIEVARVAGIPGGWQLVGIPTPGTKTNGTTIGQLPAGIGCFPGRAQGFSGVDCDVTVAGGQSPHLAVNTDGTLVCFGLGSANVVEISGFYSVDW